MAFKDQMKKFVGRNVKVETVRGNFVGRLIEVKSTSLIIRETENNRRIVISASKIIAVSEQTPNC
ncbi:hypothetical protein [Brevibacillus choshinensis]|uniref:Ribosome maturation factor RimP C-terminal domain-containing protein n=1 Tax=Brevibacillus choshinensis TaxID=54911 RepID=A0ABX7FRM4_BRECH|nr:hypothetical protein [Brevibacillus choshinensis]QRG68908.1 hypothetical protein JNE38_07130 [Brevibacillus choshinensis]